MIVSRRSSESRTQCSYFWPESPPLRRFGVADDYHELRGPRSWLRRQNGLDVENLVQEIGNWCCGKTRRTTPLPGALDREAA